MSPTSPTSPRHISIQIDPHQSMPPHRQSIASPGTLSPSRALGPSSLQVAPSMLRGNSSGRAWDEAQARERQRLQDIDSAKSMSRARSGSMMADPSPNLRPSMQHYQSSSPIDENTFPMLSDMEEAEMDRARQSGFRDHDAHSEHSAGYRIDDHEEDLIDHSRSHSHHGDSLGSMMRRHSDEGDHRRERSRHDRDMERFSGMQGGLAPFGGGNRFDFGAMEEFAATERDKLGLNEAAKIPAPPANEPVFRQRRGHSNNQEGGENGAAPVGSYETAMERTNTFSAFGDEGEHVTSPKESEGGQAFARRRQRKLSASNPVGRRGGKLALFEGFGTNQEGEEGGAPFKAARHPKNALPIGPTGGGIMPYSDNAPGHDRPYRFSFYSNSLPVTIHARTLAELPAEGQTFEDLFKGRATAENGNGHTNGNPPHPGIDTPREDTTPTARDIPQTGKQSLLARAAGAAMAKTGTNGTAPPPADGGKDEDPEASTWWLDVLSPTDEEMRMLAGVFGIHPLTTEDILLEETREKIELFRNYYLVCFRSFDQDPYSQTYLEPLNMYIIVFREGTLSFHFRGTPHPQNVRRRIKHLKDYISVTSDWISYALIDDITDAFGPLIQSIEYEVDSIDELVLILKDSEQSDMLRRIGTCRKKVMGLLRLMGNKADVVKGLAKRCNEQWLIAPKSDIGLYLSDIQDHLITMTQNLNHYEKILSRSHSNYLAQISIEMTDANNQINDVLSKLTALGTVLIPMNLVTGLWGMNVHVPGQDEDSLYWFAGIVSCLAAFAIVGAWATYKCFVVR
ncbi:uncharacterized protein MKK02DRAFT_23593 [Dioszegia hungarica]|uniref:Cora-domain-containing protein n=1 Tax=Dioszegia hungarica TaxID=4972 RepID=A0AA38LUL7_9TREE|nr:uncharacterized protein MKK02DRAFT_23593 [Dioszegia hungarica]KAI9637557.1 hypothetical protein MKK02DRAFT_23593 [Dioszegia hungarica]